MLCSGKLRQDRIFPFVSHYMSKNPNVCRVAGSTLIAPAIFTNLSFAICCPLCSVAKYSSHLILLSPLHDGLRNRSSSSPSLRNDAKPINFSSMKRSRKGKPLSFLMLVQCCSIFCLSPNVITPAPTMLYKIELFSSYSVSVALPVNTSVNRLFQFYSNVVHEIQMPQRSKQFFRHTQKVECFTNCEHQ